MKPIPNPYPKEGEVGVYKVSVTYAQCADQNSPNGDDQYLTISTQDVPVGPDEFHYYLEIKTKKWCFDSAEEMKGLIEDFVKRVKVIE